MPSSFFYTLLDEKKQFDRYKKHFIQSKKVLSYVGECWEVSGFGTEQKTRRIY